MLSGGFPLNLLFSAVLLPVSLLSVALVKCGKKMGSGKGRTATTQQTMTDRLKNKDTAVKKVKKHKKDKHAAAAKNLPKTKKHSTPPKQNIKLVTKQPLDDIPKQPQKPSKTKRSKVQKADVSKPVGKADDKGEIDIAKQRISLGDLGSVNMVQSEASMHTLIKRTEERNLPKMDRKEWAEKVASIFDKQEADETDELEQQINPRKEPHQKTEERHVCISLKIQSSM
uniref:Uncharacterized protein n=1 Tax=Ditylenchus dipsaci TaxID=166011 RepID=A0A915CZF7_9BILA